MRYAILACLLLLNTASAHAGSCDGLEAKLDQRINEYKSKCRNYKYQKRIQFCIKNSQSIILLSEKASRCPGWSKNAMRDNIRGAKKSIANYRQHQKYLNWEKNNRGGGGGSNYDNTPCVINYPFGYGGVQVPGSGCYD